MLVLSRRSRSVNAGRERLSRRGILGEAKMMRRK